MSGGINLGLGLGLGNLQQRAASGPAPYHASAVHFDGLTELSIAILTAAATTPLFSYAFWFKAPAVGTAPMATFVVDPENTYATEGFFNSSTPGPENQIYTQLCGPGTGPILDQITNGAAPCGDGNWHVLVWTGRGDTGVVKAYLGQAGVPGWVDVTGSPVIHKSDVMAFGGLSFHFGGDSFGDCIISDIADVRIAPGQSWLTGSDIDTATLNLFADPVTGKPINPAVATAALGAPAILFSGNASTFGENKGTGGAFATTGALTNASSSPSDDPYHASAVHFDGATWLSASPLTAPADNGKLSFCIRIKAPPFTSSQYPAAWIAYPTNYLVYFLAGGVANSMNFTFNADSNPPQFYTGDVTVADDNWHTVMGATDTSAFPYKGKLYVDDIDVGTFTTNGSTPYSPSISEFPFYVGADSFGDNFTGDLADVWVAPGVSLLDGGGDIPLLTRRNFTTAGGKPVNPSVYTGLYGGSVLLSGDATTFGNNQLGGGAFAWTGTPTDAIDSPSD